MVVLVLIALVLVFVSPTGCEVFYVRGSSPNATACPPEASPCLSLQEYVNRSSEFLPENISNVEMRFLSGEHSLNKPFLIHGGSNITLSSANDVSVWRMLDVAVKCRHSYFLFRACRTVKIHGLAFHTCGLDYIIGCDIGDSKANAALTLDAVVDVNITDVQFIESNQAAIFAARCQGQLSVTNMHNKGKRYSSSFSLFMCVPPSQILVSQVRLDSILSDDAIYMLDTHTDTETSTSDFVVLQNVTIVNTRSSDIVAVIVVSFANPVQFSMIDCNFLALRISTSGSVTVMDSVISGYQDGLVCTLLSPPRIQGGTDYIKVESDPYIPTVFISNCTFTGGVTDDTRGRLAILNPNLVYGHANVKVLLKDISFENNTCTTAFDKICSIVVLANMPIVHMEGVRFTNNGGTPLLLYNTTVHIFGENYFTSNQAFVGGGMAFIDKSFLVLHNDSRMVFKDNHADNVGGVWYVSIEAESLYNFGGIDSVHTCFLTLHDLPDSDLDIKKLNISVQFINNTARNGGNVLFGGEVDICLVVSGVTMSRSYTYGYELLSEKGIFVFEPRNDISKLSSFPTRVCLCEDGVPNCLKLFHTVHGIYPGQSFNASVVAVGQRFGVANGTVYSRILSFGKQSPSRLEFSEQSQIVGQPECTTLSYALRSKYHHETIALTASDLDLTEIVNIDKIDNEIDYYNDYRQITRILLSVPVYINVSLVDCPAGFTLSDYPHQCICGLKVTRYHLSCDINIGNGTVKRSGSVWVSYLTSNQSKGGDGVVVSLHCPNGYCKQELQYINLDQPDAQCNFNRSGILCGGCPPGLSLALGSDRCLSCSNGYAALLIPFALSGVVLVLFIQMLNLTVAVGTINGLIFYANIIKSYESLFFVPGQTNILTVFIAWLNLDLGIETCFFVSLNGYIKTWLQFAFPVYLWVLAGLIVVLCHYTTWFSASNSVPVLATMFLLSYNKLLRAFIISFSFVNLELPDSSTLITWKLDANLSFLDTKHVVLFLTSLLVFALAWLPYTLVLTFYQRLLRINHKRCFRWVFHLKPFFDANFGPLKVKHLYWVGALLFARAVLLLIFVVSSNSSDSALISVVAVCLLMILYSGSVGHTYKIWALSLLESSFFVNLIMLCVCTYYTKLSSTSQAPVVYTSISVAFLQFIGVVCFHCYKRVLSFYHKFRGRAYVDIDQGGHFGQKAAVAVTQSEVGLSGSTALREPLLDEN